MAKLNDSNKAMQLAERICRERGGRMTTHRRSVLAAITASDKPLGAYDIMATLRAEQPKIAPPTVYRALDFLLAAGLVHKLETLHAYVGCGHPDHPHFTQFLICDDCGNVDELHSATVGGSLDEAARSQGFKPDHSTVEVVGRCANCQQQKL